MNFIFKNGILEDLRVPMQSIVSSIILGCWPISLEFKIKRNNRIECTKPESNVKWALVMILQKPKAGQISYLDLHLEYRENILTSGK